MPTSQSRARIRAALTNPPARRTYHLFDKAYDLATAMGWKYLGQGRHRATFAINNDWVIKIPIDHDGEEANISEYEQCHDAREKIAPHVAWCMIDEWNGVVVNIMERVTPANLSWNQVQTEELNWVGDVDMWQVGYTKERKLVAYDYSHN